MDPQPHQSIKVEIYNQTYQIRGDGNSEYIQELAMFVDRHMREIASGTLTVDSLRVAILAALHIADELHQLKQRFEELDDQVAQRSSSCGDLIDQILRNYRAEERRPEDPLPSHRLVP
jgi:cell division protein ZapA